MALLGLKLRGVYLIDLAFDTVVVELFSLGGSLGLCHGLCSAARDDHSKVVSLIRQAEVATVNTSGQRPVKERVGEVGMVGGCQQRRW